MFDFHTHILPGIDDGSSNLDESLLMLQELALQGVDGIAATPHFYAEHTSPDAFFKQRENSWELLKANLPPNPPDIRLGAEVKYFEGINRFDALEQFCIEGTSLLLLEMPNHTWTNRMISAIAEINRRENITVLLAHIERYLSNQKNDTWEFLLHCGIRMQASADFFLHWRTRRTAIKLVREGKIHLLGTDCHNMKDRKPNMAAATNVITRSNKDLLSKIKARENILLLHK